MMRDKLAQTSGGDTGGDSDRKYHPTWWDKLRVGDSEPDLILTAESDWIHLGGFRSSFPRLKKQNNESAEGL